MDIKELYLSDINNDGEFWSQDKIDKLNIMFAQLAQGLPEGFQGSPGASGNPGQDGVGGQVGPGGTGGIVGNIGNQGQSLWKRETINNIDSIYTGVGTTSLIIGGTSTLNTSSTCDDGTVVTNTVPITGGANPSTLRIHAIGPCSTTAQRNHIKLKDDPNEAIINLAISGLDSHSIFTADKINLSTTNILFYDGSTAISAFTDDGITIHSDLAFDGGQAQTFSQNLILTTIANILIDAGGTVTNTFVTCNTGLAEGNVEFTDISSSFTNFPVGSIVQINDDDYDKYFHTYHPATLSWVPATSEGYEMKTGRGETGDKYEGWYLCQPMKWRNKLGTTPSFSLTLPSLNTVNSSIFGDLMPSTIDNTINLIGGADIEFTVDGNGDMTMLETFNAQTVKYIGDDDPWVWYHRQTGIARQIYICYLGQDNLVWYTDPSVSQAPVLPSII
jgi:hypothetical protein